MNQIKFSNSTNQVLKRSIPLLLTISLTFQILLTGCASPNSREELIGDILAKENVLIEKVKFEREQASVSDGVQQSESLKKAEAHLTSALEEIRKANEIVAEKLLKQTEKEVKFGRSERTRF